MLLHNLSDEQCLVATQPAVSLVTHDHSWKSSAIVVFHTLNPHTASNDKVILPYMEGI